MGLWESFILSLIILGALVIKALKTDGGKAIGQGVISAALKKLG
jgi:hypothetical protein